MADIENPQTNASALTTGTLPAGRMPALTGDVTTSAGSVATTLAAGSASNLNSGTLPAGRLPALTGDVTSSAGSAATTLAAGNASNLNSGTLAAARGGTGVSNSANTTVTTATSIGRGQYQGTNTNDSATAGNIGERIDGTAGLQTVSLSTGAAANVGSASLTAGDWEVTCQVAYLPAASTTVTTLNASVSATSAVSNGTLGFFGAANYPGTILGAAQYTTIMSPPVRISLAGTTTYYCVAQATFGISTMTAGGSLHAVRVR
jgi:hypothetical protein